MDMRSPRCRSLATRQNVGGRDRNSSLIFPYWLRLKQSFSNPQTAVVHQALVVLAAAICTVVTTIRFEAGITSDSVHYLAAARNLVEKGSLVTYTGLPFVSYAPGLAIMYAVGYLFGMSDSTVAVVTNLLSLLVIAWVSKQWIDLIPIKAWQKTVAIAAVVWAPPIVQQLPYAMSEPPFIASTLAGLYSIWKFTRTSKTAWLLLGCLFASAAGLIRYIGISMVITGTIFLSIYGRKVRKGMWLSFAFAVTSFAPIAVWLLRNKLQAGTLFGVRDPSDYTVDQILYDTMGTIVGWFVPDRLLDVPLFVILSGIGIGTLVATATFALLLSLPQDEKHLRTGQLLTSLFIVLYGGLLIHSASTVKFTPLVSRYWSPIGIPMVWLLAGTIPALTRSGWLWRYLRWVVTLACIAWLLSGVYQAGYTLARGYPEWWTGMVNNSRWKNSDLMSYVARDRLNGVIYTNYPEHLYYMTGTTCYWLPYKGGIQIAAEGGAWKLEQFLSRVRSEIAANRTVYIVYFSFPGRTYPYSPQELERYLQLSLVFRARDGEVFKVSSLRTEP